MIIQADLLAHDELSAIQHGLTTVPFYMGHLTAGTSAKRVKDNEQAEGDNPAVIALSRRVRLALEAHPLVRSWVRPIRWSRLIFSRYGPGQSYGMHTDNATMDDESGWPLRTDISFTLFLSEPESYEGGALVVRDLFGDCEYRPKAGSVIFYPTGQIHRVAPVTSGVRLACVGWMQSSIRRSDQREILFDLEQARSGADGTETSLLLDKSISNLLRMWAED